MPLINDIHVRDGEDVSMLQEVLEGFTGKTNFTKFLLAEIAANIMTTNNQANVVSVGKPQAYDDMKKCPDIGALNTFIDGMSDNDKSGCLVYALYEKEDNTKYINALAAKVPQLSATDMKMLMQLFSTDKLDDGNVSVFLNNQAPIAQTLAAIMG